MSSPSRSPSTSSSTAPAELPSEVYLAQLHDHFNTSRLHSLEGKHDDDPLPPSIFPPNAHWTSKEKDLFFHGLTVHSRLRPDLIAQGIKTKTLVDVCVYLDMLQDGLDNLDVIKERENPSGRKGRKVKEFIRDNLPIAMEMSEQWCQFEAQQASLIAASEATFHALGLAQAHEAELEAKRKEVRAPKGGARDENNKRDRIGERMRGMEIKSWLKMREGEWEVEERLEKLGQDDLKALDMLARGSDEQLLLEGDNEGRGRVVNDSSTSQAVGSTMRGEDSRRSHQIPGPSSANTIVNTQHVPQTNPHPSAGHHNFIPTTFDEALIDPVLRSATADTPTFAPRTPPPTREPRIPTSGPLVPEPSDAPFPEQDDTPSPDYILSLSPNSRRRLQKRMYMRRKRAEKAGRVVDTDPGRLKPGRKTDPQPTEKGKGKKVDLRQEAAGSHTTPNGAESVEQKPRRHPNPSGLTRPYKTLAGLKSIGLNAETLKTEGLDIFRFNAFHKLMRIYRTMNDPSEEVDPQISFTVLKTLHASVVVFVYEVIRRSLMVRGEEVKGKSHSRVWRKQGNHFVHRRDVESALRLLGAEGLDRKKYFEGLLESLTVDLNEDDIPMDVDDTEDRDRDALDRNSDSDEESWLGDGEESDDEEHKSTGNQTDSLSESGSPSPSVATGSTIANSSESGTSRLGDDHEVDLARRKNEFLASVPPHRRIFPPFVRLPRSYGHHDTEGNEMGGQSERGSLRPYVAPWSLLALTQGDSRSPTHRSIPPLATNSRTRNARSPLSTSLYIESSSDSRGSSDSHPKNDDDDDDDIWLASEDNLDFKDVEKETEYEKSLWAMFATDDANRDEIVPDDRRRTKRKRQHSSQEDTNTGKPPDGGQSNDEPERKKKKTRRTMRKRRIPGGDQDAPIEGGNPEESAGLALRYAPPGTGRVKSAVYITDSD